MSVFNRSVAKEWRIPLLFGKASDIEKVDAFLAPMNNSKTAKLPETIKEAREKAAAKKKPKAKAKSASRKAPAKSRQRIEEENLM